MGEIGFPRHEYLYELTYCDLLLITRGFQRRQRHGWEQARLIAYHVRYCMGLSKGENAKTLTEWLPFPWEHEQREAELPSEEEIKEMQALMDTINQQSHTDTSDDTSRSDAPHP